VATDNVGNTELPPSFAEATTSVENKVIVTAVISGGTHKGTPLTYDGTPFAASATATVGGTDVSSQGAFAFTYYSGSTVNTSGFSDAPTAAGTYTVVAHFLSTNPNYPSADSAPVTFVISPAPLVITAADESMTYGGVLPAFTANYSGFVPGDNSTSLSAQPIFNTVPASSHAGKYAIDASGAVNPNYTITFVPGILTINQAPLLISADNKPRMYGSPLPALTVGYSGFVNGDSAASLTTAPTLTTTASATSPVGTYAIMVAGAVDSDYNITYIDGTLTITPATLTITADSKSKLYGAVLPPLTASYFGLVNGDTATSLSQLPTLTTTATAANRVGQYPITAAGAVDANYLISYVPGTLNVTQAPLTITANNQTMTTGSPVPTLTVAYSGFVNGDTAAILTNPPIVSTTATSASSPNTYPITASGAVDPDYAISYVPGTLTIASQATATNVTSTASNGAYAVGTVIRIAVTFSHAVFVTGTPKMALNSGGTASYIGGSGTDTLAFSYTVAAGENTNLLDEASATALTLNGGTILDAQNAAANPTLPAPGTTGALGQNTHIVIDTTAPVVTDFLVLFGSQSYSLVQNAAALANRLDLPWEITGFKVVFSETIDTGTASSIGGVAASGLAGLGTNTLTWTFPQLATAMPYSINVLASGVNALKDAAGNTLNGGTSYLQSFKVLMGDFNGDGQVDAADLQSVKNAMSAIYNVFADFAGDGKVDMNDYTSCRSNLGKHL
jgi:hypothetical protein